MRIIFDPQNNCFGAVTDVKEVDGEIVVFLTTITLDPADAREYHQAAKVVQPLTDESLQVTEATLLSQLAVLSKVKQLAEIEYPENVIPVDFSPPKKVRKT
jgi:hypothetical protein